MEFTEEEMYYLQRVSNYVLQNPTSTNTKLFSFLALLNAYLPDAFLLKSECHQILGPPDPIHGGPPFEERMEPFTAFIGQKSPGPKCSILPGYAQTAVRLLAELGISRSFTVNEFMVWLCRYQPQPHILQSIKEILTKREIGEYGKAKFSRLIEDILNEENFNKAVSVLETASDKWRQNFSYPQTLARLYYYERSTYRKAEEWAKEAIKRAPNNSYVADTLGRIRFHCLSRKAKQLEDILDSAEKALTAFKDVEEKAEREEGPEMEEIAGTVNISNSFNNRGLFGFMQVAKKVYEKLRPLSSKEHSSFIEKYAQKVEDNFEFFERYLTYSKAHTTSLELPYFWKEIVLCYELFTSKRAADSTSFAGLLDCLNHGLFTSKGKRSGFEEAPKTVSDLEEIQGDLKTIYEANADDINAAERYILSNIILSNKMPNSPQLTPVRDLQAIIHRFLDTNVGFRSPEFYLLVLLLFWPDEEPQVVQEENDEDVEQQDTEDDGSEDETCEDEDRGEEQEEPKQPPPDLMFDLDLPQNASYMEKAFERADAKYLRGRVILPLFFLGKGSGLSKWIHKSRLDAIVEEKVDAMLSGQQDRRNRKKWKLIKKMWKEGNVWKIPEIQDMLLPVQVEQHHHEEEEVIVCVGGKKILPTTEIEPSGSEQSRVLFYLGFNIKGPVIYTVRDPYMSG